MISHRDQTDLDWFFGRGLASQERSTCGPMLDRASAFHIEHVHDPELAAARRNRKAWEADPGDITARPTAEIKDAGRSEPEHHDLVRYGRVSRRLARLESQDYAVIAAYFGDAAARWARADGHIGRIGRLGPVLTLTGAGRELLERERRKSRGAKLELSDTERIENAVAMEQAPAKTLIERALDEAREAVGRAAVAWVGTE